MPNNLTPNSYDQGTLINANVTITDTKTGAPVDPTALKFAFTPPGGVETVYSYPGGGGQIVRDGVGLYHVLVDTTPGPGGRWEGRWYSTGTGQAAVPWAAHVVAADVPML